jgi:hypothetical protein
MPFVPDSPTSNFVPDKPTPGFAPDNKPQTKPTPGFVPDAVKTAGQSVIDVLKTTGKTITGDIESMGKVVLPAFDPKEKTNQVISKVRQWAIDMARKTQPVIPGQRLATVLSSIPGVAAEVLAEQLPSNVGETALYAGAPEVAKPIAGVAEKAIGKTVLSLPIADIVAKVQARLPEKLGGNPWAEFERWMNRPDAPKQETVANRPVSDLKQYNLKQVELMKKAGIPNEKLGQYLTDSLSDSFKIGSYAKKVINGEMSEPDALNLVKQDYRKLQGISEEIPKFKNTEDATVFGLQNKDNLPVLQKLVNVYENSKSGKNLFDTQLYREAIESARGFSGTISANKQELENIINGIKNPEFQAKIPRETAKPVSDIDYIKQNIDYVARVYDNFKSPEKAVIRGNITEGERIGSRGTVLTAFKNLMDGKDLTPVQSKVLRDNIESIKKWENTNPVTGEPIPKSPVAEFLEKEEVQASEGKVTGFNRGFQEKIGIGVGRGASSEQLINQGMADYQAGKANPDTFIQQFERDGSSSPYGNSVIRAKMVQLDKVADEAMGTPNAEIAEKQAIEYHRRIDPLLTAWHDTGMVFQGANSLDTGSYTSIRNFVNRNFKRDLTPSENLRAKDTAAKVTDLNRQINEVKGKLVDVVAKESVPPQVKAIWNHAKSNYIDKGQIPFDILVRNVAQDLKITEREVIDAFAAPKTARQITIDMYRLMNKRRDVVNSAKHWVGDLNAPWLWKPFKDLHHFIFGQTVLGHAVGMETHAGQWVFDPTVFNTYWRNVGRQFKIWANSVAHEKLLQDIESNPYYYLAKRSGLGVDIQKSIDQYQLYSNWIGKIGKAGSRSMDALKSFRLDLFQHFWEQAPKSLQTADYAKELSSFINHSTGVSDFQMTFGKGAGRMDIAGNVLFASRLEGSRWARLVGDPAKHIATLTNPKATPAEKAIAIFWAKRTGIIAGTYLATLAVNDGLNMALGSNTRVNFTDPTKADFLCHKIGGRAVDLSSKMLSPLRFMAQIVQASITKPQRGQTSYQRMSQAGGQYLRGKLTPAVGLGVDIASGTDYMGRPMPFSSQKVPGKPKYTWPEYILSQRGPIPMSGMVRELADIWRTQGISQIKVTDFLKALAVFGTEAVGVPVKPKPAPEMRAVYLKEEMKLLNEKPETLMKYPENIEKIKRIRKVLEEMQ